MSVEHADGRRAKKQAVLLLGVLLTSGACTGRHQDTRSVVGASRASGSSPGATAADVSSAVMGRSFRAESSRALPLTQGPGLGFEELPKARSLARGAKGNLLSTPEDNQVYALVDEDGDHRVDRVHVVPRGSNTLSWSPDRRRGSYDAEISRALGMEGFRARPGRSPKPVVVVTDKLPSRARSGWRYVRFGADGWLYIPVRVAHEA